MDYLRQVQRGIDFIESHLQEDFSLNDVSRAAGVSHWQFLRTFKALSNETLKSYIRSRRLSLARMELITRDDPVLAVALRAGFESQASFTRAFQAAFGMPPARYRALGGDKVHLHKLKLDEPYLRHLAGGLSLEPKFEQRPARQMVGLVTRFYGAESERNDLADKLPALWMAFLPRLEEIPKRRPGVCYGIIQQATEDDELLEYTAAMQVDAPLEANELPPDMHQRFVPASEYASFEHRGFPSALNETVNYIYGNWLLGSAKRHNAGPDVELYDHRFQYDSPDSVIDYEVPVSS